jgi:hypothetical protein
VANLNLDTPPETSDDLFCPQCGYNLRGLSSDNCPECGLALDRADMLHSRLPWTHRRRIGYFRAYWRTLILGTFSTPELADELARPVSFRDAQLFRFITIAIGWLPLAIVALIAAYLAQSQGVFVWRGMGMNAAQSLNSAWTIDIFWPLAAGAMFPGVVPLALAVFLIALSGVASYFFHPKSMPPKLQNRGVAMSYYACAAIAFVPLSLVFAGVAIVLANTDFGQSNRGFFWMSILGIIAFAAPFVLLFIWWVNTLRLYARATKAGVVRVIGMAVLLPLIWILCAAFTLVAVTWVCGFLLLVLQSL